MSNVTSVVGKIHVPLWPGWEAAWQVNRAAIETLPQKDQWPHLTYPMFAMNQKAPAYDCRLIHFAASMKGLEEAWEEWIAKFESLLRKMSWITADVYLDTEYFGKHIYWWAAKDPSPGSAITVWDRSEGPWTYAEFEQVSGKQRSS